jgi:hypothetical protein
MGVQKEATPFEAAFSGNVSHHRKGTSLNMQRARLKQMGPDAESLHLFSM